MSVTEPVACAIVGIISGLFSGGFVAVINWLATRRKTAAETEAIEIQNEWEKMKLAGAVEGSDHVLPDNLKPKSKPRSKP